ncbi:hypothetical protein [Kitasatospora cheerisanensis]|uniref:Uncharacterized protein n=1 Tax=Kitasatospora cheerisanensis KCTC 2395 TaxID=1348663 RepID=A0A066YKP7_9ACTN|nr:hypothetical protein [Kitasatospora cheerisanensis]KDN82058.1 hypothetical protein KCH_62120 [Kitasatospora cheerisanensis KCTC 2395]
MNITATPRSWGESVALFESRGLPVSSYQNLYPETYDVHPGSLTVTGPLDLDATEPYGTGFVVDGDLEVTGAILNVDDGCPALIVLGDLTAGAVHLEGDAKLLVRGTVRVGAFVGHMTDKLVMIGGDLHAGVTVLSAGFFPDEIAGALTGPVLAAPYVLAELGREVAAPPAAEVLVAEVLRTDRDEDDDTCFDAPGIHGSRLRDRLEAGLPVLR